MIIFKILISIIDLIYSAPIAISCHDHRDHYYS